MMFWSYKFYISSAYQQRLPYELLSNLASAMLDETVSQIVAGLKEIQAMTEKTLFESRMREIGKFRGGFVFVINVKIHNSEKWWLNVNSFVLALMHIYNSDRIKS